MAGDWIPMRIDLPDDPAVIAIAATTGLDEFAVVGRLQKLWGWANKHLADGVAVGISDAWIDRHVAKKGFAAAMIQERWLSLDGDKIVFTNFDRWNSKGAKVRLTKSLQKRTERRRQRSDTGREDVADMSLVHGDNLATCQRQKSPMNSDQRREEKRREDKDTPKPPQAGAVRDAAFCEFWEAYPRKQAKESAWKAWKKLSPDAALLAEILAAIQSQKTGGGCLVYAETADGRSTIPHPATWLNSRRWEDVPDGGIAAEPSVIHRASDNPDTFPDQ